MRGPLRWMDRLQRWDCLTSQSLGTCRMRWTCLYAVCAAAAACIGQCDEVEWSRAEMRTTRVNKICARASSSSGTPASLLLASPLTEFWSQCRISRMMAMHAVLLLTAALSSQRFAHDAGLEERSTSNCPDTMHDASAIWSNMLYVLSEQCSLGPS